MRPLKPIPILLLLPSFPSFQWAPSSGQTQTLPASLQQPLPSFVLTLIRNRAAEWAARKATWMWGPLLPTHFHGMAKGGNGEPVVSEPCPPRAPSAPHILCASSRCCSTKEGIRISGQRYMRLVPSGILLWTPGTMSQCPKGDCVGLGRMCLTLGKWTLGTEEEE